MDGPKNYMEGAKEEDGAPEVVINIESAQHSMTAHSLTATEEGQSDIITSPLEFSRRPHFRALPEIGNEGHQSTPGRYCSRCHGAHLSYFESLGTCLSQFIESIQDWAKHAYITFAYVTCSVTLIVIYAIFLGVLCFDYAFSKVSVEEE